MAVSCQILINKPNGCHRPGQPVTGVIKYALDQPLEVNNVVLSLIGEGECSWTETESKDDKSESKTYYGKEQYIKDFINILEKKTEEVVTIPPGSYERPFEFCLPTHLPPSFKNYHATISYKLELKFKRPGVFRSNKRFTAEIPVRSCMDSEPDGPLVFGVEKTLTKLFTRKKPVVNLKAKIVKTRLSPCETAHLDIVVTNDTSVTLKAIRSELMRYITYTANCGRREYDNSVVRHSAIESTTIPSESVVNLTQEVPISSIIYTVRNSRILSVEFKVRVTVRLPVPHINASVEVPVLIEDRCEEYPEDEPPSYLEVMCEEEKEK